MSYQEQVMQQFPEAQAEERYYGKGTAHAWFVFPAPWRGPKLGAGPTPQAAWKSAAESLNKRDL